jgi:hypothetical protein
MYVVFVPRKARDGLNKLVMMMTGDGDFGGKKNKQKMDKEQNSVEANYDEFVALIDGIALDYKTIFSKEIAVKTTLFSANLPSRFDLQKS